MPLPYGVLLSDHDFASDRIVEISEARLRDLLRPLVKAIKVDEAYYFASYQDVRDARERGKVTSAREHYCSAGYFEDRIPYPIKVDQPWYLDSYPDVRDAIGRGEVRDAQSHFERDGFREGRLPFADWTL